MKVRIAMPVPYEARTVKYWMDCPPSGWVSGVTNQETIDFFTQGYLILRDVIPKDVIQFALDCWLTVERNSDFKNHNLNMNHAREKVIATPLFGVENTNSSNGGHSGPHSVAMNRYVHRILSEVLDIPVVETYSFSRKYFRNSFLGAHTDRPSCEISATMCLNYKTDDGSPWKIWVRNDDDYSCRDQRTIPELSQQLSHVERKLNGCKSIELFPGDLMFYMGPNVIHWRDRLLGDYSYHIFCHYAIDVQMGGIVDVFEGEMKGDHDYIKLRQENDEDLKHRPRPDKHPLAWDGRKNRYASTDEDDRMISRMFNQWFEKRSKEDRKIYGHRMAYRNLTTENPHRRENATH